VNKIKEDDMTTQLAERTIEIPVEKGSLGGVLMHPPETKGMVLFVHGSGSGRSSPRNQFVSHQLNQEGFSTLLFNLLTPREEAIDMETMHLRFNIELLTERLVFVTDWIREHFKLFSLPFGYFSASTGTAAAVEAAIKRPYVIKAIVSRGGRPDLAPAALSYLKAPTLFIVGENDHVVMDLNRKAMNKVSIPEKDLKIIPGATHLFEEPGALEKVSQLADEWFQTYLV
jgi:putative phosphoribosyl transferase